MFDTENGSTFTIDEWWDRDGNHYDFEPTEDQLLADAVAMTGHLDFSDGNTEYFSLDSFQGWEMDELRAEVDDAEDFYGVD